MGIDSESSDRGKGYSRGLAAVKGREGQGRSYGKGWSFKVQGSRMIERLHGGRGGCKYELFLYDKYNINIRRYTRPH